MRTIGIINGPNLNLLGTREPTLYGNQTLDEIEESLAERADLLGVTLTFFQSNHEGEIVDHLHRCRGLCNLLIINAGAFTHTSIAIRDAILGTGIPAIEVHLSNIYKREDFRKTSYLSDVAVGVICGFGPASYALALEAAADYLNRSSSTLSSPT